MNSVELKYFTKEFWSSLNHERPDLFGDESDIDSVLVWHDRPKAIVYRIGLQLNDVLEYYYLKQYKINTSENNAFREYSVLCELVKVFDATSVLGVIEPIAYVEKNYAFVTKEFVGVDLYNLFKSSATYYSSKIKMTRAVKIVEELADWVIYYQKSTPEIKSKTVSRKELVDSIHSDIVKAVGSGMYDEGLAIKIRKKLQSYVEVLKLKPEIYVPSNGDAKIWNFLVDKNDELRGLDFVGFSIASPAYDFSRLWVGMNWLKIFPWVSSRKIKIIQNAFVDRIFKASEFNDLEFEFYKLCMVVDVATFYSKIRSDKYRRKFRNIAFFFLIKRYYKKLLIDLVKDN